MAVGTNGGQASVLERGGRNCFGEGVAVEPSRVYWTSLCGVETEQQFGRLFALPVGGGAPVTVASRLYGGTSIAADADNVYVGGSGHVTKVSKATGTTTPLAAGNWQINGVAVDTTHVYWTAMVQAPPTQPSGGWAGGIVMKIPVAGGTPETLASGQIPGSIVVDATSVYWLNALDKPDRVMRLTPK